MATNNLKKLLESNGIKQVEFAKKCNLSEGYINKVCNQKRTPAPTTITNIVNTLNGMTKNSLSKREVFPDIRLGK